ncbi:DUF3027 domain-containing protein [Microbacterium sp. JZ70]
MSEAPEPAADAEALADSEAPREDASVETAPVEPDPRLLEARDLALAALREITPAQTIGEPAGYTVEGDGVVSLRFENRLSGYPGWHWTVSLAVVEDAEPTVLEAELLPGDGALLAPEWVPWSVRLEEYKAAQSAAAEAAAADESDEGEDFAPEGDEFDQDEDDFDEDGSPILHAGDVDGVDIDELDAGDDDAADDDDAAESDEDYDEDDDEARSADDDADEDDDAWDDDDAED